MQTASFFTKGIKECPGRISIARRMPQFAPAPHSFKPLAPGTWFNSASFEEYTKLYQEEILGVLNPQQVWKELHNLAGEGNEPVLLCWECLHPAGHKKHNPEEFCHRRQVATWLETSLGVIIPEMAWQGVAAPSVGTLIQATLF